jgi:hypothetical protein
VRGRAISRDLANDVGRAVALAEDHRRRAACPVAAASQARLLLGPQNVVRMDPMHVGAPIELDDYRRATDELQRNVRMAGPSIFSLVASDRL